MLIRVELILRAFDITGLPGRDLILESRCRNKREIFENLKQIDRETIEISQLVVKFHGSKESSGN